MMRVLVVGSGAREHALVWKLRQSPRVEQILVAPGNAGTAAEAENVSVAANDLEGICRLVVERAVDLTVIGPEAPLALGLADRLRAGGQAVFGPDRAAARLEWSKSFAKEMMAAAGVPTAHHATFDDLDAALAYLDGHPEALVVKADGLAAGKGVTVAATRAEARRAVQRAFAGEWGEAGRRVVIEERLCGPEISLLALVDGERVVALPPARDHKRLCDGDQGPNTGGMGAYAPVPGIDVEEMLDLTVRPIVAALAACGITYCGALFAGLILAADGPRVLEYNCRLGDPETQVILPLLDGDLLDWLEATAAGRLPDATLPVRGAAVGVVLAAAGYPDAPVTGTPLAGLDALPPDTLLFHGGTARDAGDQIVSAGGRIVTVVGVAPTIPGARERAYAAPVHFAGMQRRLDIACSFPAGKRPRLAVLAAGGGSNLQALIDSAAAGMLPGEIAVVVSHRAGAGAIDRAHAAGIPAHTLLLPDRSDTAARRQLEQELLRLLSAYRVDLAVLAGWMLVLSAAFLRDCPCPLINVHPALLPWAGGVGAEECFPVLRGAHAVREAIRRKLSVTGVSVHLVTPEVDAGPVLVRREVPIEPGDTEESLYDRIKTVEHRLLPEAIQLVLSSRFEGGAYAPG